MVYIIDIVDINEYIASGILESVTLGLASQQEMQEVACLSKIYPEIQAEFVRVQKRCEEVMLENAQAPDAKIRASLLQAISEIPQEKAKETKQEAKIVSLNAEAEIKGVNPMWKLMAAASLVLTLGIGALWIVSKSEAKRLDSALASMEKKQLENDQVLQAMTLEKEHLQTVQEVLAEQSMRTVTMNGTAMEPDATVKVMWSTGMKKAVMHADKITPPPANMQYQLWVIADGKPVSVGVFTYDEVDQITEPFDVNAQNITAFAITLEKMGGSPTPTMEKMVVMGAING
ncbi:anti-sigma factor [Fluviicola taffensis]|uniref:Anti-sigma-K factor RskA n=1 Tax=Fluviicola taffensis (strain DSM 16823 / NCIMB 13979 / RW262) TaxID=755732 RepID=F2IDL6_FLUTR|nr:anti-sigma factor [Fluviicola taffensis]AEA43389.1 Anti-sigma-K factor RskA [Fluviicola taffensis DSM 16823]